MDYLSSRHLYGAHMKTYLRAVVLNPWAGSGWPRGCKHIAQLTLFPLYLLSDSEWRFIFQKMN